MITTMTNNITNSAGLHNLVNKMVCHRYDIDLTGNKSCHVAAIFQKNESHPKTIVNWLQSPRLPLYEEKRYTI